VTNITNIATNKIIIALLACLYFSSKVIIVLLYFFQNSYPAKILFFLSLTKDYVKKVVPLQVNFLESRFIE